MLFFFSFSSSFYPPRPSPISQPLFSNNRMLLLPTKPSASSPLLPQLSAFGIQQCERIECIKRIENFEKIKGNLPVCVVGNHGNVEVFLLSSLEGAFVSCVCAFSVMVFVGFT